MIFHTLANIEPGKPYQLQKYIDNKNGNKTVGLKNIIFCVGYFDIGEGEYIIRNGEKIEIKPGKYTFEELKKIIWMLDDNKDGFAVLAISDRKITISKGILLLLGFEPDAEFSSDFSERYYFGNKVINQKNPKELRVCLEQLNTESNYMNGAPSQILNILSFNTKYNIASAYFDNPSFKPLQNGIITELTICLKDEKDNFITNYRITAELCIK